MIRDLSKIQTMTAWEAIGTPHLVKVYGGRTVYENVHYDDSRGGRTVRLDRIEPAGDRLRVVNRYVHPDTVLEVVVEN